MFKILEKFVQNLKKLDNYYLLRQEEEYIIVGTKIIIIEYKIISQPDSFTTITPNELNKDYFKKELPVFFLVTNTKKSSEIEKTFKNNKLPVLDISGTKKNPNIEDMEELLTDFIKSSF